MRTGALTEGVGFAVSVPGAWFELDLHPATREASLRELVAERLADVPALDGHLADLTRLLEDQSRQAWESGVSWCACLAEVSGDSVVTAAATISLVPAPLESRLGDSGAERLAPIRDLLTAVPFVDDLSPWRDVAVVEHPETGPQIRTRGIEDVEAEGRTARVVLLQSFLPLPTVNQVLLMSLSSPALHLSQPLLVLFAAIADTVRAVTIGEPSPVSAGGERA